MDGMNVRIGSAAASQNFTIPAAAIGGGADVKNDGITKF